MVIFICVYHVCGVLGRFLDLFLLGVGSGWRIRKEVPGLVGTSAKLND
jgi:hypothetical protein